MASTIMRQLQVLADLERFTPDGEDRWPSLSAAIPAWHPRCEGDDGGDAGDTSGDGDGDAGTATATTDDDGDADTKVTADDDWKVKSRKHETRAKRLERERDQLKQQLAERQQADLSEQERAVQQAREQGKAEALTAAQLERRMDRLEIQVVRHAAGKFADPDDALVFIARAIDSGDLDLDDLVDEKGKVIQDALQAELVSLLERKPQLKAGGAGNGGGHGDAEGGAGSGGAGTLESASVEDHMRRQGRTLK